MASKVQSIIDIGFQGVVIDIECNLSNNLPNIVIVGFANKAVDEAKERLRSAFTNSRLDLPRKRITLNLAPADIPKDGTSFDLAMATSILLASEQCKGLSGADEAFIGELSLTGTIRPVRGVIGKILAGRNAGIKTFYLPTRNVSQAQLIPGITLIPVPTLRDLYLHLNHMVELKKVETKKGLLAPEAEHETDTSQNFRHIVGQARAKRALEIAAAGAHNVLLNGPPGTGKSMLAKALPSILPPLEREAVLEVTHLHSLASKQYETIVAEPPFRAPHHSASDISIIGGGTTPKPGEISLAHHGVLFMDELPEFDRPTIEALRQPLEDKTITVARAKDSITFPANFILIGTSNPCPCGYYGTAHPCSCLPYQIIKYERKLSGPIVDRIDMYIDVDEVAHDKLLGSDESQESSASIAKRVRLARTRQEKRFGGASKTNSDMDNRDIKALGLLSEAAQSLLNQAAERLHISPRAYMRTIKVARTIADLADSDTIEVSHMSEALQYRRQPTTAMSLTV